MAIYRAHRQDWESGTGASSGRPKKAKASASKPVEASEPEHVPRRMASKGRKGSLNLAATLRHAQPADDGELVVHTSESVAAAPKLPKAPVKASSTAPPSSKRPSKARSGKGADEGAGNWWETL